MLKDSEDFVKRRKLLSLTTTAATDTRTSTAISTTPPRTPPTPPLNMMMTTTSINAATTLTPSANVSALTTLTATPTLTTTTMAAEFLANSIAPPCSTTLASITAQPTVAANVATPLQDHYSLRWNNHQNHILRAFDALLQTKALVDVTLVCAETSIQAHKIVLSACSPFFQRVFAENPCKHPVIVLKDFRGWVVQAIVDFMYRGEISVPQERLQTLIQAGESLQVRGLVESSVPEHTPTPAASPDDFGMIDTSLMSSELERCSSFDEESPSMVTAGSKVILPSRLFGSTARRERERERERERKRERERDRERERERERELERSEVESDAELQHELSLHSADLCTSPMPRRKQARPRRRSGELPHDLASKPASPLPAHEIELEQTVALALDKESTQLAATTTAMSLQMPNRIPTPTPTSTPAPAPVQAAPLETLKTVIKSELTEPMEEDDVEGEGDGDGDGDSGNGNDSQLNIEAHEKSSYAQEDEQRQNTTSLAQEPMQIDNMPQQQQHQQQHRQQHQEQQHQQSTLDDEEEDDDEHDFDKANEDADVDDHEELDCEENEHEEEEEPEDIEELINTSNELRRKSQSGLSEGPEDLCTTKKDNDTSGNHSAISDPDSTATNNNNNNSKLNNNNNRIVLSLKDIRHLNKPSSSNAATSSSANNAMHPFNAVSLRDLRLDRSNSAIENQCKIEALEAQMHAAAAAAACAASGENPFQHMEHQMDLSLAAAAAAAAVSRERDEAIQREHRELQHHHNAYANSILGQMGMPGIPPYGPGGPAPHERLEESMNRLSKEFAPSSPMSLPSHFNPPDGPPHPPSPLPFPVFGLDSPLGLFPPGIDPGKLYNPLMDMSDPRGMGPDPPPFLKKKMPRPKGQHSAPRGGPPRSWTNAELTEALQHVWNKKMTTSQASRIFGIPYNSLLMYVRGKYGKSLKLEQLRKDCISGPPLELLQMGISGSGSGKNSHKSGERGERSERGERDSHKGERGSSADMDLSGGMPLPPSGAHGGPGPRSASSEPDLLGGPNSLFNPFPQGFYPDFPGGFPGLPLGMLNLLPPTERHHHGAGMHAMSMDEDCKSDRSKHSSMDEDFGPPGVSGALQPLALSRGDERTERPSGGSDLLTTTTGNSSNSSTIGPTAISPVSASTAQANGAVQD